MEEKNTFIQTIESAAFVICIIGGLAGLLAIVLTYSSSQELNIGGLVGVVGCSIVLLLRRFSNKNSVQKEN